MKITYISYISATYLVSISSNTLPSQKEHAPRLFYAPETVCSGEAGKVGIQDVYRKPMARFMYWRDRFPFLKKGGFIFFEKVIFSCSILWNKHDVQWQFFSVSNTWVTCDSLSHDLFVTQTRCACSVHILSWNGEFEGMKGRAVVDLGEVTNRLGCFYCFLKVRKNLFVLWVNQFRLGILLGKVRELEDLPEWWGWMLGWKCRECVFFIDITCHFLFRPQKMACFTQNDHVSMKNMGVEPTIGV